MIGVFVGFVGKPTPMSGVFEDLSTFPEEEDMFDVERISDKVQKDFGESGMQQMLALILAVKPSV